VVQEMVDKLVLGLVEKDLLTDQIVLMVGYDIENLTDPERRETYSGEVKIDFYGRKVPKHARGTVNMDKHTSSTRLIMEKTLDLFDRIVDKNLLIRRLSITSNHLLHEEEVDLLGRADQLTLFDQPEMGRKIKNEDEREKKMQKALLEIKNKFGANAILKGTSYMEGATGKERNATIGGHKA